MRACSLLSKSGAAPAARADRRHGLRVQAAASWTRVATQTELREAGGRKVVETSAGRVLLAEADGQLYAVSNKCTHLGLPLVGKTAMLQGVVKDKCIVCPAHGTAFSLADGSVQGEWCPNMPSLPFVGKVGAASTPLPVFESRVAEDGGIEVLV